MPLDSLPLSPKNCTSCHRGAGRPECCLRMRLTAHCDIVLASLATAAARSEADPGRAGIQAILPIFSTLERGDVAA